MAVLPSGLRRKRLPSRLDLRGNFFAAGAKLCVTSTTKIDSRHKGIAGGNPAAVWVLVTKNQNCVVEFADTGWVDLLKRA